MAGVQGSALAVAVSNAGGLGSLPARHAEPDAPARPSWRRSARGPRKPFNVNFFCHTPTRAERRARGDAGAPRSRRTTPSSASTPNAIAAGPARLPFDARGRRRARRVQAGGRELSLRPARRAICWRACARWGAKILSSATTVDEARWLEARGVDAVIAQGIEAGGHRGDVPVGRSSPRRSARFALVPQIVDAVKVPVIAAGGIADARGVAAAMALGASGVQVGTAYLLCPEATTSAVHRAALESDAARVTALTNVFTGRPARAHRRTASCASWAR